MAENFFDFVYYYKIFFFSILARVDSRDYILWQDNKPANRDKWVGKVNFVEIRSFWHIFRSFDRMWGFFILCLQVMNIFYFVLPLSLHLRVIFPFNALQNKMHF